MKRLAAVCRWLASAVVIDGGNYPEQLLLGMSYLDHVDMEEKDNILTLRARY